MEEPVPREAEAEAVAAEEEDLTVEAAADTLEVEAVTVKAEAAAVWAEVEAVPEASSTSSPSRKLASKSLMFLFDTVAKELWGGGELGRDWKRTELNVTYMLE